MRAFKDEIKYFLSKFPTGSWARAFGIVAVCLTCLAVPAVIADSIGLLYLYSFDRDPKNWTNLISFYFRPTAAEPAALDSLIARGDAVRRNRGNPVYARHFELTLADIKPSALHDCLLAAEDKCFYLHTGLDYVALAVALYNHFTGGQRRGGSTISVQLMGEVILADRSREGLRGYLRKIQEIILTNVAERHISKDDLMLAYVNNVPVGDLDGHALIGLAAGSQALFGKKEPRALTLSEACALAGMLNRPDRYIKYGLGGDYDGITKKRNAVLDNLQSSNHERYSKEAIERAKREPIRFVKGKAGAPGLESRRLINYAFQQLQSKKPGQRVYLAIEQNLQRAAEDAVNKELAASIKGHMPTCRRRSLPSMPRAARSWRWWAAEIQPASTIERHKRSGLRDPLLNPLSICAPSILDLLMANGSARTQLLILPKAPWPNVTAPVEPLAQQSSLREATMEPRSRLRMHLASGA